MKKKLFLLAMATMLAACEAFSIESAPFAVYNQSVDRAMFVVSGTDVRELAPNGSANFMVNIRVARRRVYDSGIGPSQIDKQTFVSVAFRNLRTGLLSNDTECIAGAKITTNVRYDAQGWVSCQPSYTSY